MSWIDCGVNIAAESQLEAFKDMLDEADDAGVQRFVIIASNVAESHRAVAFAEQDERCIVTVGVHPHHAAQANADFIHELRELAQHPKVRAIGECGLDYNRNYSPPEVQRRVFAAQVQLANDSQLPLYLHERDALDDQLSILTPAIGALRGAFTHCFTGNVAALNAYQQLGCYIGVTGWVCDERRGMDLANVLPNIQAQRLLLETDTPYLLPRTLRPRPKSGHNRAKYVAHIGEHVANLRNVSAPSLASTTSANAMRLFGDW